MMYLMNTKYILLVLIIIINLIKHNHCQECEMDFCSDDETEEYRVKRSFVPYKTGAKIASEVSGTLDDLLMYSGYDKRIRPQVIGILVFNHKLYTAHSMQIL